MLYYVKKQMDALRNKLISQRKEGLKDCDLKLFNSGRDTFTERVEFWWNTAD